MSVCVDLTGKRFGNLTVLRRAENYVSPKGCICSQWECECDCGNKIIVSASNLKSGRTARCHRCKCQKRIKDISGRRFGKITVIECVCVSAGKALWRCKCDCGNEVIVPSNYLISGGNKSCGCRTKTGAINYYQRITGKHIAIGERIIFLDGDRENMEEENMVTVSDYVYQNLQRNNLFHADAELKKTAILAYQLVEKTNKMEKSL